MSSFNSPRKSSSRKWYKPPYSKKEKWILAAILLVVVVVVVGAIWYAHDHKKATPRLVTVTKAIPKPVITSPLSGLPVTLAQSQLPVTGVMIENTDQARPQSGLSQAGVVFEAIAEAGITRFLALYQEGQPTSIGPVRSARPYYIDWLLGFDAAYAHVGGSADALSDITTLGVKDMNEFYYGSTYTRISQRQAPHNVYTSMSNLLALETTKGWTSSKFTPFPRKADSPAKVPNVTSIDISPSSSDFAVHYDYNQPTNSYNRSEAGTPMVDANTNKQLSPKVVIAIVVPQSQGPLDASGAYYTDYADIGSGQAYVFQDGGLTTGTWTKSSATTQIQFTDASGNPIKLDAGQTWITAIGSSSYLTYK